MIKMIKSNKNIRNNIIWNILNISMNYINMKLNIK